MRARHGVVHGLGRAGGGTSEKKPVSSANNAGDYRGGLEPEGESISRLISGDIRVAFRSISSSPACLSYRGIASSGKLVGAVPAFPGT